jgi:hypothetical protein
LFHDFCQAIDFGVDSGGCLGRCFGTACVSSAPSLSAEVRPLSWKTIFRISRSIARSWSDWVSFHCPRNQRFDRAGRDRDLISAHILHRRTTSVGKGAKPTSAVA